MSPANDQQDAHDRYETPLVVRNASEPMIRLFSPRHRIITWRRLWLALAEAQQQLGLEITDAQIAALKKHLEDIDFEKAAEYERRFRHDVMAHIHAYAEVAPEARGILHLGATSAFVGDNGDLVIMREALERIGHWLANVADALGQFAMQYKDLPCLGSTHFQPAQVTTVGKRAALWCWDFVRDLHEVERLIDGLPGRRAGDRPDLSAEGRCPSAGRAGRHRGQCT